MRNLGSIFLLSGALVAVERQTASLSDVDALRLENVAVKLELLESQAKHLQNERNEIIKGVCAVAKIDIKDCVIDPAKRTVSKREAAK